jgi:integrase
MLGIYTGARVNELAQLEVKDIIVEEGIPAITITASGGTAKRIKSESSRRTIPLHKDLLTLGFLVYVSNIRQQGHTQLFPTLKPGPNGYQHYFNSHHFAGSNGWLRKQLPDLEAGGSFHLLSSPTGLR